MKILEINKFYYIKGGSERHYFDVIKLLEKNGHEVISFSMKDKKNLESRYDKYFIDNIDYSRFRLKNIYNIFWNFEAVRKLKKLIRNEKPEIAHLHNIAHQISPAIIKVLKKNNIPIIQTLHDYKVVCPAYTAFRNGKSCFDCVGKKYFNCVKNNCHKNSKPKSLLVALESYLHNRVLKTYNLVDYFIAPSEYLKNVHVQFGVPKDKIVVINNFVSEDNFSKNILSDKRQGDYFLYFGRLSKEKGIDLLIDAFKKLNDNYTLKLIGSGPEEGSIRRMIEKENLQKKIELLGYKKGKKLFEFIKNARAILLPSVCLENMPYSMLEAMYLGKVVIASNAGGISEIIRDGENGFLFMMGDAGGLSQKITDLDNKNLDFLSRKAQETVKNIGPQKYLNAFQDIIEKINHKYFN